jgi:proline dehydrogenase
MLRQTFLYLSKRPDLKDWALQHPVAQRMAARFVAGDTLEEAIEVAQHLNQQGLMVSLNHLGEHVTSRSEAVAATEAYLGMFDRIAQAGVDANVSVKLTQLGIDIGTDFAYENLRRVVAHAAEFDNFVRIDMESSAYTQRTLDLYARLREAGFRNVGVVIQSYLYRSEADVEWLISLGANVRLCKGAYMEPPQIAFPRKRDVDENFVNLMRMLFSPQAQEAGVYPAIATHDDRLIYRAQHLAQEHGVSRDGFEFQLIYGVRRELQAQLVEQGYRVRVYVPFGVEWYPYFMRRLAERPANVVFLLRALARERLSECGTMNAEC